MIPGTIITILMHKRLFLWVREGLMEYYVPGAEWTPLHDCAANDGGRA